MTNLHDQQQYYSYFSEYYLVVTSIIGWCGAFFWGFVAVIQILHTSRWWNDEGIHVNIAIVHWVHIAIINHSVGIFGKIYGLFSFISVLLIQTIIVFYSFLVSYLQNPHQNINF